jgi:hypothetical protein
MIDVDELKKLIRRIVEQEVRKALAPESVEEGALVLLPTYVPDPEPLKSYLKEKYAYGVTAAGEGAAALGAEFITAGVESPQDRQRLIASLKSYEDILLAVPPLWMLKNIAIGDDRGFFEQTLIHALLWKKNVYVVLDFERPGFGRAFEGLSDDLRAIENMGAKIVSLKLSVGRPEGQLSLVTEAEVTDAQRQGRERLRCAPGAIVTPLARDAAKELGIEIEE